MCGIAGIFSARNDFPMEEPVIRAMANELAHRGPDEMSSLVEAHIALGFRRLSIVDVSHGHQPFFSEDDTIILICNGEIYNYRELRSDLEASGYRFKTNCDVEVIVHLYHRYGVDFLHKLNGQFAFAIYDRREKRLMLARDQFGICPLFYTAPGDQFLFGSEIKAILQHPAVERKVCLEGLDQVLSFPGLVSPTTMFEGIYSVPPGHYMLVDEDGRRLVEYWDLDYPQQETKEEKPESYYIEQLEALLLQSVKYRLNADVPIGFYLSGGLDSSLIGAMIRSLTPDTNYPSFSIVFPAEREMDERKYQLTMIDHLDLDHTEIVFDSHEIDKRLKQTIWASETALKETYNTCSLALSQAVNNRGIKVILSGEGSDEFFGGYVGYRFDKQRMANDGFKDLEEQLEDDYRNKLWGDPGFFYEKDYYQFNETKCGLYAGAVRQKFNGFNAVEKLQFNKTRIRNRHILHKRSYVDLKLRLSDHLIADHCDRVSHAHSVEGRFPFLDINLIEFVKTIPPDLKLNGLVEKYILKKVAKKYVPADIINRQKFGFVAPGSTSLINKNVEWINDMLSYDQIKRQGYFDADVIERLKKQYAADDFKLNLPFDSDLLIVVLTFNIFLELFNMPAHA